MRFGTSTKVVNAGDFVTFMGRTVNFEDEGCRVQQMTTRQLRMDAKVRALYELGARAITVMRGVRGPTKFRFAVKADRLESRLDSGLGAAMQASADLPQRILTRCPATNSCQTTNNSAGISLYRKRVRSLAAIVEQTVASAATIPSQSTAMSRADSRIELLTSEIDALASQYPIRSQLCDEAS
jgi:hypothetical protein